MFTWCIYTYITLHLHLHLQSVTLNFYVNIYIFLHITPSVSRSPLLHIPHPANLSRHPGIFADGLLVHSFLGRDDQIPAILRRWVRGEVGRCGWNTRYKRDMLAAASIPNLLDLSNKGCWRMLDDSDKFGCLDWLD